jgi:hypothetical protein
LQVLDVSRCESDVRATGAEFAAEQAVIGRRQSARLGQIRLGEGELTGP